MPPAAAARFLLTCGNRLPAIRVVLVGIFGATLCLVAYLERPDGPVVRLPSTPSIRISPRPRFMAIELRHVIYGQS